jgi:hypothetical protein
MDEQARDAFVWRQKTLQADTEGLDRGGGWKQGTSWLLKRMEELMAHGLGEERVQGAGLYNPFL